MLQDVPGFRKLPFRPFGMSSRNFGKVLLVVAALFSIALLILNGHR
jgi:hypothetical protein